MQLTEYWAVIRRHLWIVLLLPTAAFVASSYLALRGPMAYVSTMKLIVSVRPITDYGPNVNYDPQYYAVLVSEYLADDLTEVLRSQAFAQDVSAELGYSIPPALIANGVRAKKTHRIIDFWVYGQDRGVVAEVGQAYERVLNTRLVEYFSQLQSQNAQVRIINGPGVGRANTPLGMAVEIGLRTLLGLALGLGLAFLLDYVDDRLRDRRELERLLGVPILAEVPRGSQI
jgi:capsular polysaccharide biosynthesis protein